jgi:class 3 adenylate cyclase
LKKVSIFVFVFTLLNLSFIPLMSLYGLSVCPILKVAGFTFGCAYAGTFILSVLLTNLIFIFSLARSGTEKFPKFFRDRIFLVYVSCYALATIIGLVVLRWLFDLNHLTGDSRAPEILAFTSAALGITQAYGLNWALPEKYSSRSSTKITFDRAWMQQSLRTMLPIFIGVALLIHFMIIQSFLQQRRDLVPATVEDVINQTNYLIMFLVAWLLITYSFHFLSERDCALKVNFHIKHLESGEFDYVSSRLGTWGLWASLIDTMNDFSKAFSERTKLLKSFSRFVSGEVANLALKDEISSVSGTAEELTVVMSDIRGFTRLSEQLEAQQVVLLLNGYFTAMIDEMIQHSVVVDKFIGDGILAYVETDTHDSKTENQKAVEASFGMLQRLELFNKTSGLPPIKIGLGVCRGPLIKGNIGSHNKLQHTIIGDTVNRAARLESLCKELGVPLLITVEVWNSLEGEQKSLFRLYENMKMNGITNPINVYGLI